MPSAAIEVVKLSHHYRSRQALEEVSLTVERGTWFAVLGPNGSGKTTLFRLLSTLLAPQQGEISIFGHRLPEEARRAQCAMGVVFQSPSLDRKLTVRENLIQQAALYGLGRKAAVQAAAPLVESLGLSERLGERTETLSGGLRRRVELAKALLHQPQLLLLDEPCTGLDPGARRDLWTLLARLRDEQGITIALTTHLLDEADQADQIAIFDQGKLVSHDSPAALRSEMGGDILDLESSDPQELAKQITERFTTPAEVVGRTVRVEHAQGHQFVASLAEAFGSLIERATVGRPTLEDVFIRKTGHRLFDGDLGDTD